MIKTRKNIRFISITTIVTIIAILMLIPGKVSAAEPAVLSVSHQPITVSGGTNVTVTVTFDDDENITAIRILYCALEPEYQCHVLQIDMISTTANIWEGSFIVIEEDGIIGYEIDITHTSGSIIAPNSSDYLGHDNIAEPFPGLFYFTIEITTPTGNAPLNIGVPGVIITYLVYTVIRKRNNK